MNCSRSARTAARSRLNRGRPCEAGNLAGTVGGGGAKTPASFEPFKDFNQFGVSGMPANPLVAQNRTYTRYETRLNEPEYSALSGWGQGQNLPDQDHPAHLPDGAIAVKASWRLLTAADTPAVRARYYVVENANVVNVAKTLAAGHVVCSKSDVALVGLHIVIRTSHRPQGVWASFEHVDNVPPAIPGEPDAKDAGAPYSYFNPSKPNLGLWPQFGSPRTPPSTPRHSAQDQSRANADGAPASDPSLHYGDESILLVAAGTQGNRLGALHAGVRPMAKPRLSG